MGGHDSAHNKRSAENQNKMIEQSLATFQTMKAGVSNSSNAGVSNQTPGKGEPQGDYEDSSTDA